MKDPTLREALYDEFARVAHAMASPKRLRLVNLLCQGPKPVEALAAEIGESIANTSAHLKVLRDARLIEGQRHGRQVLYDVTGDATVGLWMALRRTAEVTSPAVQQIEARHYGADVADISPERLAEELPSSKSILLDLRAVEEYRAGHLPRARSLPFAELDKALSTLPRSRRILAYCRGKYCAMAVRGVTRLRQAGLRAQRLPLGVPEWRALGLPLEIEPSPGGKQEDEG